MDFHIDQEALDQAFEELAEDEDLTDEERELLVPQGGSGSRRADEDPERIARRRAQTSSTTTDAKVAPLGLKAQVVAFDRELCVAYHEEITRLLAEPATRRRRS